MYKSSYFVCLKKNGIDKKCIIRSHQTFKSICINCVECYSLKIPRVVCALLVNVHASQLIFSFQIVGTLYDLHGYRIAKTVSI